MDCKWLPILHKSPHTDEFPNQFLAAVIALATACLAVGLWLLLSPRMIFGRLSM
jgi:hypothetical protein